MMWNAVLWRAVDYVQLEKIGRLGLYSMVTSVRHYVFLLTSLMHLRYIKDEWNYTWSKSVKVLYIVWFHHSWLKIKQILKHMRWVGFLIIYRSRYGSPQRYARHETFSRSSLAIAREGIAIYNYLPVARNSYKTISIALPFIPQVSSRYWKENALNCYVCYVPFYNGLPSSNIHPNSSHLLIVR